jgi:hypothetical protein
MCASIRKTPISNYIQCLLLVSHTRPHDSHELETSETNKIGEALARKDYLSSFIAMSFAPSELARRCQRGVRTSLTLATKQLTLAVNIAQTRTEKSSNNLKRTNGLKTHRDLSRCCHLLRILRIHRILPRNDNSVSKISIKCTANWKII